MKWYVWALVVVFAVLLWLVVQWVDAATWSCGEVVDGVVKRCVGPSA